MDFDDDVKSARERYDFTGAKAGSSLWVKTKGEAIAVRKAFTAYAKDHEVGLTADTERVHANDKRGAGYRIYFHAAPAPHPTVELKQWIIERTKPTTRPPKGGWHMISALHLDYEQWFTDAGHSIKSFLPLARFSQMLAAMPDIQRKRYSEGSVAIGIALKDAEIFTIRQQIEKMKEQGYSARDPQVEALEREQRRKSITEPCKVCRAKISVFELSNDGKCQPCVDREREEELRRASQPPAEYDADAALRAKLEAKRKADRGE